MQHRKIIAGLVAACAALTLAACGSTKAATSDNTGSAAAGSGNTLAGKSFVVSSKDFTESILLGKMTKLMLEANGATVTDKTDIKGSVNTRNALLSGDIDMYWDYTGTGWVTYLKKTEVINDPAKLFAAVQTADAANGVAWLPYAPMNNTYAFAFQSDKAAKLGVTTLSDVAKLAAATPAEATFCIESEFASRDDGWPGVQKAYGMTIPDGNVKTLDTGVIYSETAKADSCNFGEVFATDGRIKALGLTVLKDDKAFFPIYNGSLTMKQATLDANPGLATIIAPLSAKLDDATMTDLNSKVDAEGGDPDQVAKDWLTSAGLIK